MNRNRKRGLLFCIAVLALLTIGYYDTKPNKTIVSSGIKSSPINILCLVLARQNGTDLQQAIIDTWGSGCAHLIFLFANNSLTESQLIERQPNIYSLFLPVEEHFDNTWMKIRAAMHYIHTKWSKKFDWLLRIDDDAFVIFENLRTLITALHPNQPIMFGSHYPILYGGYIGTGPGILVSRGAFNNLMKVFDNSAVCKTTLRTHNDDVQLGACLRGAKVPFGKSSDDQNRPRYISISVHHMLNATTDEHKFFKQYSAYPIGKGLDCCADELIALHYTSASDIRLYYQRMQEHPNSKKSLKLFVTGIETPRSLE
uniref:N-acetylgalactosaminide beta-1,3-galactosyltransferase n=1 Tax=Plectus sambesii TaxID=2011161 RepID=A0A914WXG3_9BILA